MDHNFIFSISHSFNNHLLSGEIHPSAIVKLVSDKDENHELVIDLIRKIPNRFLKPVRISSLDSHYKLTLIYSIFSLG